jgi:superfamily I DNA/RNA helicase
MPEAGDLLKVERGAIVAPAGHGKTELIANIAALGRRTLVLTHTNAGIQAIRSRLKRLRVPQSSVAVDTIAGWSLRYAHSFPGTAKPPAEMPDGAEWDDVQRGVRAALAIPAVRQVVEASYDRVLIDEYQDCNRPQHELAMELSAIAPTLIFGDPMQGIFEFAGATLSWPGEIHHHFPLVGELETPHRWRGKNEELGEWIMDARGRLMRGERVEGKEGTIAAIHCRKGTCLKLAAIARGGYQAIEEMAAKTMTAFARAWDASPDPGRRLAALREVFKESFTSQELASGEEPSPEEISIKAAIQAAVALMPEDSAGAAHEILTLSRKLPRWRLHRQELLRDVERAISELAAGRSETMLEATVRVRDRASVVGRKMPRRTVSTPLLLKGLEFDHVVVPYAPHFGNEDKAQAKQFYVAISRSTRSLTITGKRNFLQLPPPRV